MTSHPASASLENKLKFLSDPELCRPLLDELRRRMNGPLTFMEVCGTHTVSIFRSGLRDLLPPEITHLSGPGCPVCVTHEREVAAYLDLAGKDKVIIATFGDLMRVPGPGGLNLKEAQARGSRVAVVYSPHDALDLAAQNPGDSVVFLGIGFETTAPAVAATIRMAEARGLKNFYVLSFHKLVPPALEALLNSSDAGPAPAPVLDAFLLPGHVSTILGLEPYAFVAEKYRKIGVVGGFEPADIITALLSMLELRASGRTAVVNRYQRAVSDQGSPKARRIMGEVFDPADALWRGLGLIPRSGLRLAPRYESFDAWQAFGLTLPDVPEIKGCRCGDVLRGMLRPDACPLFGKACTPAKPVGPCMVSTEGSCAAYFKYNI